MSLISTWSTTAADNSMATPNGWPEGQAPSTVNNCARQMMATIRTQMNDAEWFDWGFSMSRVSGTVFRITSATSTAVAVFLPNRRLKLLDTSTMYGTITEASVSATTTNVTFLPDSGSLTNSFSSVQVGILSPGTNNSIPKGTIDFATQAQQETGTSVVVGVSPGVQQYHPSACKVWARSNATMSALQSSYNVSSITDGGAGIAGFNFTVNFSSTAWTPVTQLMFEASTALTGFTYDSLVATTAVTIVARNSAGTPFDPTGGGLTFAGFGDQ